jgi:hypothetical protein
VQRGQQAQPVQAQVGLLGIDHHAVEEGVDRLAQRGQRLQRAGVVAGFELARACGRDLLRGGVQRLLGVFLQQPLADVRVGLGRLLQDVADALVGGGQRGRLGQRGEGAHGGQALGDVAQALRQQRQHGVDFLRAVALLAQRCRRGGRR